MQASSDSFAQSAKGALNTTWRAWEGRAHVRSKGDGLLPRVGQEEGRQAGGISLSLLADGPDQEV